MVSLWLNNAEIKFLMLLIKEDEYTGYPTAFEGNEVAMKRYDEMRDKLKKKVEDLMKSNKIDIPDDGQWSRIFIRKDDNDNKEEE